MTGCGGVHVRIARNDHHVGVFVEFVMGFCGTRVVGVFVAGAKPRHENHVGVFVTRVVGVFVAGAKHGVVEVVFWGGAKHDVARCHGMARCVMPWGALSGRQGMGQVSDRRALSGAPK